MLNREFYARKFGQAGAYFAVVPFVLFGVVLGARYGLELGSGISNMLFFGGEGIELVNRLIIGGSMICGIMAAGVFFAGLCYTVSWALGYIIGSMRVTTRA